jgi:two-component sensor histidine kinase
MALHELATNAAKYGALSNDIGSVEIQWETGNNDDGLEFFTMSWSEEGGPCVVEPARRGFGSTIIQSALQASVRGTVDLHYVPSGLQFKLIAALPAIAVRDPKP